MTRPEVVVATGASAGVGRATLRALARRGAHVGLLARSIDGLEAARREVEADGGRALVLPTDVADADAARSRRSPACGRRLTAAGSRPRASPSSRSRP